MLFLSQTHYVRYPVHSETLECVRKMEVKVIKLFLTITVWTQVPDAIKSQYQNPPPMLLPAGVRQLELVCSGVPDHQPSKHLTTQSEQQEVGTRSVYKHMTQFTQFF